MDYNNIKNSMIDWVRDYFNHDGKVFTDNKKKFAIVGISGGKDSTIVGKILCDAITPQNVIGILMPCGKQSDFDTAKAVLDYLQCRPYQFNVEPIVKAYMDRIPPKINLNERGISNLKPRIRMSLLYLIAASFNGGRVANTSNLSEKYLGYSTKYGDNAGDFSLLGELTCTEVVKLGQELGIPDEFVIKKPEDGLTGKTDEENFGFSYDILDKYIRENICDDVSIRNKIDKMHNESSHKRNIILPTFNPFS